MTFGPSQRGLSCPMLAAADWSDAEHRLKKGAATVPTLSGTLERALSYDEFDESPSGGTSQPTPMSVPITSEESDSRI